MGFTRSSSTGSREVETVRWWPMLHIWSDKGSSQVSQATAGYMPTRFNTIQEGRGWWTDGRRIAFTSVCNLVICELVDGLGLGHYSFLTHSTAYIRWLDYEVTAHGIMMHFTSLIYCSRQRSGLYDSHCLCACVSVREQNNYPRRARSALGVDTVLTLDVCMYVCMYVSALERKRLIGMTWNSEP